MKSIKVLAWYGIVGFLSNSFLLHAEDLLVMLNTLSNCIYQEAASDDESQEWCDAQSHSTSDALVRSYRGSEQISRSYINKVIVKTVEAPALDEHGHLTEEAVKILLSQAYKQEKLTHPAFKDSACLKVTDIKNQEMGNHTTQLFLVESTDSQVGENLFIFKGIGEKNEIEALVKGSRYEDFEPIVYPNAQTGYPQIVFPIAYLSYKDTNGQVHFLSLMNVALGQKISSIMEKFANQSISQVRESMHRIITEAYFHLGAQMAKFYQRYATNGSRLIPMGIRHGDLHLGNIFYDPNAKQITLIDNNRIAISMGRPESVWRDFVPHLVKTKPPLKMDPAMYDEWFSLSAPSFIIGFLSIYPAADHMEIIKELEEHMKTYECNENKKMRYAQGVVHHALHALGKNMKEFIHDGNVFKRLKISLARRTALAQDVPINAQDEKGKTMLFQAITEEPLLVWPLIVAGAEVNARDNELNTPLHIAAQMNNVRAIKLLSEAGAHLRSKNSKGQTPLDKARAHKSKDAISELKKLEAREHRRN